jgi:CheY-like chemotaxis protein
MRTRQQPTPHMLRELSFWPKLKLTRRGGHPKIEFEEFSMRKRRPPYAPEFRRQMVELVRAGRTPEELAKEFGPTAQTIRNWVVQADRDEGRHLPVRPAQQGETILVVEDDPGVLRLVAEELTYIGYRVLTATNADEALNIIRRDDEIDVLFSDIVMLGGMNGVQLTVEARRVRPALKVLLTSGYAASALGDQGIPGDVEVLRKPYRPDELAQKLRVVISR